MKITTGSLEELKQYVTIQEATSTNEKIERSVKEIIKEVKKNGDLAIKQYTKEFDGYDLDRFLVPVSEIDKGYKKADSDVVQALEKAKENIVSFHSKQKEHGFMDAERDGVLRGQVVNPLETVGLYVPGGTASYPSSVLMNSLPAKIAGVKRIVMVTPPSSEGISPAILAAAKIAGIEEIYQIGGAQAIAALAYGTESIPKVDKIVGPGNIYVATAKKILFGTVAIDMIAGPSEIVILADATANSSFIAADLLSQAEHDKLARAILITTNQDLAEAVVEEIDRQLSLLPRREIAKEAIENHGAIYVVSNNDELFSLMNHIAPEHLEIQLENPMSYLHQVKHAGSVFLGNYASEPLGDYMAGTNHVLPTSGTARFFSPLSVNDFVKRTEFISYTKEALSLEKDAIITLAHAEGLDAHANAIKIRFEEEI